MQRLLRHADWDTREVRDDVRDFVIDHLGDPAGVLIADETSFLKESTRSAGCGGSIRGRRADGELPSRGVPGLRLGAWARPDRPRALLAAVVDRRPGSLPGGRDTR